jgi:4-hydroxy-3-methylbut-2-en-1-yl diphosphate synthase IspG/GcpE
MEETHQDCIQEDEIKGMDVHVGIEGRIYNGHGEGKDENMNMVKNIKNLQKYVQSHKHDNKRLMKSK